jgi:molecular chaperone GrpE
MQNDQDNKPTNDNPAPNAGFEPEKADAGEAPAANPEEALFVPGEEAEAAPSAEERIAALEAEIAEWKDKWVRQHAEMDNLRKRTQREKEDATKFAVSGFAKDLLAVADNLGRALQSLPQDILEGDGPVKNLAVGVEMTQKELVGAFERHGIKRVDAIGKPLDPNFHQAMFEVEDPSQPSGTVVQEVAPGFVLHGRLLRPAMVGVSKGGPKPGDVQQPEAPKAEQEKSDPSAGATIDLEPGDPSTSGGRFNETV